MKLKNILLWSMSVAILAACGDNASNQKEGEEIDVKTVGEGENLNEGEWEVLFGGSSLDNWRNFRKDDINWETEDSTLTTSGGNGDIITKDTYGNFELEFDWKISEGGNSGVMYLVQEGDHGEAYHTGPEYQIIDAENFSEKHGGELDETQVTGANYGLDVPEGQKPKPAGEWNHGKIVVNDGHVEHWVNGEKVVEYELRSDEWREKVQQTKFAEWPDYGMAEEGHIALQDHGDRVWFRDIRIKRL